MLHLTVEIADRICIKIDQNFLTDANVANLTFIDGVFDSIEFRIVKHKDIYTVFDIFTFILMYFTDQTIYWAFN